MSEQWPLFGYDSGHSGHGTALTRPKWPVERAWTHDFGGKVAREAPVVDRRGRAYVHAKQTQITAPNFRAVGDQGQIVWALRTSPGMGPQAPAPAVDDDLVVLPESPDAWVVEARTGGRIHEVQLTPSGATHPAPTVIDGRIHIGFRTFDLETGDLIWEYECDEPKYRIVKPSQEIVRSAGPSGRCPAVVDGTVFVARGVRDGETRFVAADGAEESSERSSAVSGNSSAGEFRDEYDEWGHVHALDAESGVLRWKTEFETPGAPSVPAVVAGGSVYIVDISRTLRSFDASTGDPEWTVDLSGELLSGARPAVADGTVLIADGGSNLLALDAEHGRQQWQFTAEAALAGPPAVVDETVHVSDVDGGIYAVSLSGNVRWQFDVGAPLNTGPVVTHGRLYVAGSGLHCLARRD